MAGPIKTFRERLHLRKWRPEVERYVNGSYLPATRKSVAAHIRGCPICTDLMQRQAAAPSACSAPMGRICEQVLVLAAKAGAREVSVEVEPPNIRIYSPDLDQVLLTVPRYVAAGLVMRLRGVCGLSLLDVGATAQGTAHVDHDRRAYAVKVTIPPLDDAAASPEDAIDA